MGGAFIRDEEGGLSIGHSGKIGGGRKGIGQTAFLSLCRCAEAPVLFADGQTNDMLIVGAVGSAKFRAEIGYFVTEVQRIKKLLVTSDAAASAADRGFKPEFSGKRKAYQHEGAIESVATHGLVVGKLAAVLESHGLVPHSDRSRDLYLSQAGTATHLFEVKTDLSTTSVYTAVGQLMLHGAEDGMGLRRILVVPGSPTKKLASQLSTLKITVLEYSWEGSKPVLRGIKKVL